MKRSVPRISINKLGEYMVANANRRREIRENQKNPDKFKPSHYTKASTVINHFLTDEEHNIEYIHGAIRTLKLRIGDSEYQERENKLNIEALESFLSLAANMDLDPFDERSIKRGIEHSLVGGVLVSVTPYVHFSNKSKNGTKNVGIIKVHFPKSNPLNEESATFVGAILLQHCQKNDCESGIPKPQMFRIIDIPTQQIYKAPSRIQRRMKEVQAACEEIAQMW